MYFEMKGRQLFKCHGMKRKKLEYRKIVSIFTRRTKRENGNIFVLKRIN